MKNNKGWVKAYQGPFGYKEAMELAEDLNKAAEPKKNMIYGARIRPRKERDQYDVMILTEKNPFVPLVAAAEEWARSNVPRPNVTTPPDTTA